jgi:NADH dehydrogenase
MKTLSIPEEHRDRHDRPLITPTLQLMDYPEVFAGGDCVTQQKPESALAQVAYQQAKAIARNLIAVSLLTTMSVQFSLPLIFGLSPMQSS